MRCSALLSPATAALCVGVAVRCGSKHWVFFLYEYSYVENMADDDDDVLLLNEKCVLLKADWKTA